MGHVESSDDILYTDAVPCSIDISLLLDFTPVIFGNNSIDAVMQRSNDRWLYIIYVEELPLDPIDQQACF